MPDFAAIFADNLIVVWLVVLALCLVIEVITLDLVTIWFAGGALVTFFVAMVTDNLVIQLFIFLAVSLLLLFFTRPVAVRYYNSRRTKTNAEDGKKIEEAPQGIIAHRHWVECPRKDQQPGYSGHR